MLKIAGMIFLFFVVAAPLLVRFRPRWVAAFNLVVTNRITSPFVTWLPGFGVITHVGRKSGKAFRTPVNVFRAPGGFLIALTYGPNSQWVQNVLAAGKAELETRHTRYQLSSPTVVHDPSRRQFPFIVGAVLRIIGAADFLRVSCDIYLVVHRLALVMIKSHHVRSLGDGQKPRAGSRNHNPLIPQYFNCKPKRLKTLRG